MALQRAVEALKTALCFYVDERRPLPVARIPKRGERTVRPSALEDQIECAARALGKRIDVLVA